MKPLVFGEMIWDVYPDTSVIGGAAFNFAAHLAHMGAETHFISAVGEDELGEKAVDEAKKHGIRTELFQTTNRPTGACIVTLREGGLPSFNVLQNVAYDVMQMDDETISEIKALSPDFFYFNTLCQRGPVSREAVKRILSECTFPEIVCDINLRVNCFDKDSLARCMEHATIVKISDEEGKFLYELGLVEQPTEPEEKQGGATLSEGEKQGDRTPYEEQEWAGEFAYAETPAVFTRAVAKAYPNLKLVVYTLGKNGSAVLDTKTDILYESGLPRKAKVVSTVGAGDSYGAAFSFAYLGGKTIPEAIAYAAEISAQVVESKDAVPLSMYE